MTERITLRAKSDGTEISGELGHDDAGGWYVELAPETTYVFIDKDEWDRVYTLPTAPGAVFRATVRDAENVRVMVVEADSGVLSYVTIRRVKDWRFHYPDDIDASTVRIELEGDE